MLDLGWSEMAVIALLALIVIGPKDLPKVLRTLGQFMRKARSLSREFQSGLDEVVREAELEDARKAIEKTRPGSLDREIRKALDPSGEVDRELRDLDRTAREATRDSVRPPAAAAKADEAAPGAKPGAAAPGAKVLRHPAGAEAAAPAPAEPATAVAGPDEVRKTQQTG